MSVTETTTTSWFSRLKGAFFQILIGIVLVLASIYFLFTNEGRAIQTYRALVEGAGLVVSVDSAKVDPANEGKLVHIAGPVKAIGPLSDQQFGIGADGALALSRNVEMYQWVEKSDSKTEKNVGGSETTTTTYSYSKEWRSSPVDSSEFKESGHDNPGFVVNADRITVEQATVGAFTLEGSQVANLGNDKQIGLTSDDASRIARQIATGLPIKLNQGALYLGNSASSPEIGDMKVSFDRTDLNEASFVGAQSGETIVPYRSSNGREILLSAAGDKDAPSMFAQAQSENTMITWLIRAGGMLALLIGFKMIFAFLGVIGDVIPFIGSIVRGGTTLIALTLTLVIGPVVIAVGWFAYRPLVAIVILAVGLGLAFVFGYLRRKQRLAAGPAVPAGQTFGRA